MSEQSLSIEQLVNGEEFIARHIGVDASAEATMLESLGVDSVEGLMAQTLPAAIRQATPLATGVSVTEQAALEELKALAKQNKVNKSYIGMGYTNTLVPSVILRNVLENPGWYTAYTPYQPEISQGRLESLLNFQQLVMDLTGMDLANASLLDEATAAAEAMTLCKRSNRKKSDNFFVADDVHPQTIDVLRTRAEYFGFTLIIGKANELADHDVFGALVQYPGTYGNITDLESVIAAAKAQHAMTCVAADPMALVLLKSPGSLGADVVLGSSQRFGVPMGFGGPHAAFFAASEKLKRSVPGRIIGVSVDSQGKQALRMAMQTREQHIRRDKATSNICTAQALLANMASFYAVYHGPEGLRRIAERVHRLTAILAKGLKALSIKSNDSYFDTLQVQTGSMTQAAYDRALEAGCNLRWIDGETLGVTLDETTTLADVDELLTIFAGTPNGLDLSAIDAEIQAGAATGIQADQRRTDAILTHPTFNSYQSETEMLRYMKRLENKDYSLVHGMIPLGSCTMKLNATTEMIPVTWPEFANIHPFAPRDQVQGYLTMIGQLQDQLVEITGYDAVSMQPNSGASGEYAGLLAIRKYQASIGEGARDVCLIPSSAHGTNPATASMMGMRIVVVGCDEQGNVDVEDLRAKADKHAAELSCLMVTYPSTHGVFEEQIREICDLIHERGGQVYIDGANMNAMVGLAKPGDVGGDVSHLNLHKTFAIPHGGGGPGMGPIGVKAHLAPHLPNHKVSPIAGLAAENGAVSAATYGSAAILPISWLYNRMLGQEGLRRSTETAILSANYIANRLQEHFPVLYRGHAGRVAHECIIDIRDLKEASGISEEDVAKRLMDYGFHAPTMSFPVPGTLMIEPTESESLAELDRFCDAMISIRAEIAQVEQGIWPLENNPLVNAPHTQSDLLAEWNRPYSREVAVAPAGVRLDAKYWPTVNRVDNVYGDRNFVCSCPSIDSYQDEEELKQSA